MSYTNLYPPINCEAPKIAPALSPTRVPQISARRAHLAKSKPSEKQKQDSIEVTIVRTSDFIPIVLHTPPYSPEWTSEHFRHRQLQEAQDKGLLRLQLYRAEREVRDLSAELEMTRISASEACQDLMEFVMRTKDTMVPSVHGKATAADKELLQSGGCCNIA